MRYRSLSLLLAIPVLAVFSMAQAADFDAWAVPNASIEAGSSNVLFNLTVNNTNSAANLTMVNVTLPSGFVLVSGSNHTSASQAGFMNDSSNLTWANQSQGSLVANLSQEWFAFNASVNGTPGDYVLDVTVLDSLGVTNATSITIQVNDTTPPSGIAPASPTPANGSWSNESWFVVNVSFQELNPDTCLLDLWNGTGQNWTMQKAGSSCWFNASNQYQGSLNWSVWMNDTSGNLAWNGTWSVNVGPIPHDLEPAGPTPSNGSVVGRSWFVVNFTFTDSSPDSCVLRLDNGSMHNLSMVVNSTGSFCHLNVTGQAEGHLNYTFWMNNTQGASNESERYYLTVDLTPTIISDMAVVADYGSANVSWTTGFPADSAVYYGTGEETNLTLNVSNSTQDTNHSVYLGNLSMNTEYFYNITSCDNMSVCNTSGPWNFTTSCIESWSYGEWGECSGGTQSRSATDSNSCGTTDNRSALTRSCEDDGGGGGGGSGGSDTTPTISKVWTGISPGSPVSMEIDMEGISARTITMEVSERVGTCNLVVNGYSSRPATMTQEPDGTAYNFMEVTTTANSSRLSRVVIEFSVERSWMERNGIESTAIRLARLVENWTELDTIHIASDNDSMLFRADSPGLSWFAVTGKPEGNATSGNVTAGETPSGEEPGGQETTSPGEEQPPGDVGEEAPAQETWDVCTPGEYQCVAGSVLQQCNAWGTGWLNHARCMYGCLEGECTTGFVIEVNYDQLWIAVAAVLIILAACLIYMKRHAIDNFIFWRL